MEEAVTTYINKQKQPQKKLLEQARKLILKTFPKIKEKMEYGVPCYDDKFYIVALKDHVNIGFSLKGLTKEEQKIFEGGGKTFRHIRISSEKDFAEKDVVKLMKMVYNK
jgi:uncharacterized protein YdhG (YjbR/CyaY superfamily)